MPVLHAPAKGLEHDNNTIQSIAARGLITFGVSFTLIFSAQAAGGRWTKRGLELNPGFARFVIGAAILFIPGAILFHDFFKGGLIFPASWLALLIIVRAAVRLKREQT